MPNLTSFLRTGTLPFLLAAVSCLRAAPESGVETNLPPRLPVVTVTAQKEPAAPESLPVSVTPVTRDMLRDADLRTVKAASAYAPSVFINEFTARKLSNPYFRGVGSSPNNPGVTTYLDGVPQLNANSSSIEWLDVEQAEFVRGPQGALFGRNTVGGLINVVSRRPSGAWRGEWDAGYGNYNAHETRLSASGPIVAETLGLGLAGGYAARDGFTRNDFTGDDVARREAFFGKGQLLWTPSTDWEARLILSGERDRDGGYALNDLAAIRARPHHVSRDLEGHTRRDILAPTLHLRRNGAAVDAALITGLVWWKTDDLTDLDFSPLPMVSRSNAEKAFQFTEELRFASAQDAPVSLSEQLELKWQAGLSFFTQNYRQNSVTAYAPGVLSPFILFPVNQHAPEAGLDDMGAGIYGQTTLTAWEKLDLTLGLRADYEEKEADLATFYDPAIAPPVALDARRDFCEVSPQFGLAWRLSPEKTAYANVGRGYKAGGFNPVSPANRESYGRESSWNYEIGAKTAWLDRRLSLNLALFYIHWEDLQLNLPTGAPAQFYIANAGAAASKGIELELNARPLDGWDIFGSIGCTDARFLGGAMAGHTDAFGVDSLEDVGGRHLIYTPDFTANAGMQYAWKIHDETTVYARAEAVFYGCYRYNPINSEGQDAYSLAHFRAGIRGRHWFAEGWIRNAFDTRYVPIALEFPNYQSGFIGENGDPVTFGVRAGFNF